MSRIALVSLLTVLLAHFLSQVPAAGGQDEPAPWLYAALGDSLATGVGATRGYVRRYQEHVQVDLGVGVQLINLGVGGWKSDDLLAALRANPRFQEASSGAQLLTWSIGGNDLLAARARYKFRACGGPDNQDCLRATTEAFKANWSAIIAEIRALRSVDNTVTRSMDIYNPFVSVDASADTWSADGGLSDHEVLKSYLDEINTYICVTLADNGMACAPVYASFNGPSGDEDPVAKGYIAGDGFHPNDAGHEAIAAALRQLGSGH